jgi:hypothetical protein
MWLSVGWYIVTDVLEEPATSMFMVEEYLHEVRLHEKTTKILVAKARMKETTKETKT